MKISIYAHIFGHEPQFGAVMLLMALTSTVPFHGFVNLNSSVFCEIDVKLRISANRTKTSAKKKR